jgi:selenocysteine-specific elongation factor
MIVATAGHIDHGKTSLIRALTGIETDTLREERERGISIDLGFAYWDCTPRLRVGFVDVPGHERFVRNMLAGVSGIDAALLVVAADDGVMPQTIEHLQILDLLGVSHGVVAITKCDRVDAARIAEVTAQVAALIADTALRASPLLPVSTVDGSGLDAITAALEITAAEIDSVRPADRMFRLAVDRAFSLAGRGTIVTGFVHGGAARVADRLLVLPAGRPTRLRAIQSAGADVETALAGHRCALALTGVEVRDLARGDWLVQEGFPPPVVEFHARVLVLRSEERPLAHLARLHVHLGTGSAIGRLKTASRKPLEPGAEAMCTLQFGEPISAVNGDRFILRDPSARRTVGGGRILAPSYAARDAAWAPEALSGLATYDVDAVIDGLLAGPAGEVDLERLQRAFGMRHEALVRRAGARDTVLCGTEQHIAVPRRGVDVLKAGLLERLDALHRTHPEVAGLPPLQLKREAAPGRSQAVFTHVLRCLVDEGRVRWRGPLVCLPGHVPPIRKQDAETWERILPRLIESTVSPPTVRVLAADTKLDGELLLALLHRKCRDGDAWKITSARFYPRASIAALAAAAAEVSASQPEGWFTAAHYRDRIGTGRGLAIEILEFFDRIGVTHRRGDLRRTRPAFELVVGPGAPLPQRAAQGARDA